MYGIKEDVASSYSHATALPIVATWQIPSLCRRKFVSTLNATFHYKCQKTCIAPLVSEPREILKGKRVCP